MARHVHIHSGGHHFHVHDFEESKVHRAPKGASTGGQFTKGGGGEPAARYSGPKAGKYGHTVSPVKALKSAAGAVTGFGKSTLSEFSGKEEYHDFEKAFGKPGSKVRKSARQRLTAIATALPRALYKGLRENKEDIQNAGAFLVNLSRGQEVTPKQKTGFRRLATKATVMAITGDVSGGGSAMVLAVAEEFFNHAWKEHALKYGIGGARFAAAHIRQHFSPRAMEGGDRAYRFNDADGMAMLKDFFETLGKSIETMPLPAPTNGK